MKWILATACAASLSLAATGDIEAKGCIKRSSADKK
jgi:hypothetical protein